MATIGQQLDQFLQRFEEPTSTELYIAVVGLTILVSFFLLAQATETQWMGSEMPAENQLPVQRSTSQRKREPHWHVLLQVMNYVFVGMFLFSVVEFGWNAELYLDDNHSLLKFMIGWSVSLCYFFGFFRVSIAYDTVETRGDHQEPQDTRATTHWATKSTTLASNDQSSPKQHRVSPAAMSASVCSDPCATSSSKSVKQIDLISDEEIANLVLSNDIKDHELEKLLDAHRAVVVRRIVVQTKLEQIGISPQALDQLPYQHALDYSQVHGANCEIVVGYVPLPVGMVGPLTVNGESVFVPMATTEGCLVASTNRGAKAISAGSGAFAEVVRDGITRAPCIRMESAREAAHLKIWCEKPEHFAELKQAFESTTSFGKLLSCVPTVAGKNVYLRLTCFSGDAMGMNMVSKGSLAVIECLKHKFPSLQLVALSGNVCTDKKAAAINWIEGRGKSVVVEATIPKEVVRTTLKTSVKAIVETNLNKNLIGSAMAGVIGGFNAHAANIVTAVFLATGQDPAQNVESSNCITLLEEDKNGDLWISCTMPSLEVGTVGGGTSLPAQAACLKAIGCQGGGKSPGENAQQLAKVIAAATMAGELSLLAALAANTLVAAHMQHNRKPVST